jgi:glycosyltransferase involved in cell wall biosynthesis
MFDVLSDSARKNPWGAVEAFSAAFPGRDDVRLVVKVNNARAPQSDDGDIVRLEALAASDSRVVLVEESLSREDLWSLYASCDVLVSLHRAEGLGLGPLEAMAVGAAVVATGYSGVTDFMTAENSVPVPFTLVPVTGTSINSYAGEGAGQKWAEPDLVAATAALRRLADDAQCRRQLGARAILTVQEAAARQLRGEAFAELLALLDAGEAAGSAHTSRVATLAGITRKAGLKRSAVKALWATGLKPQPPEAERSYPDGLRLALPADRP